MAQSPQKALKARQEAAALVEQSMIAMLIGYEAASDLTIREVRCIARMAKTYAFEALEQAAS